MRAYLDTRDYPGNVRDLKQLIYRILYSHVGPDRSQSAMFLSPSGQSTGSCQRTGATPRSSWRFAAQSNVASACARIGYAATETAIRIALAQADGNLARAAKQLGVTDRALQMRRATRRLRA